MKYLIVILTIYCYLGWSLLLDQPMVWSDEAIFADMAINLVEEGRLAADVWAGLLPGVTEYAGWHPPVFYLSLAGWLGVFGTNLLAQRLMSLVLGGIVVVCFAWFSRRFFTKLPDQVWLWLCLGLAIDFVFLRAARHSRPEILILTFLAVSLVCLTYHKWKYRLPTLGVLSGLALATHPYGILVTLTSLSYFYWIDGWRRPNQELRIFTGLSLLPLIIWIVAIQPYWQIAWQQFQIVASKKALDEFWIWMPGRSQTTAAQISFGLLQLASALGLVLAWLKLKIKPNKQVMFVASLLIISWLMVWSGRMLWYAVYTSIFIYLSLGLLLMQDKRSLIYKLAKLCLTGLILINGYQHWSDWRNVHVLGLDYQGFVSQVTEAVPQGSQVFLSVGPEVYYGFLDRDRRSEVIIFPGQETPPRDYLAVLNQTDYVVFNGNYIREVFGDFLEKYIEYNTADYQDVGMGTGYSALVIRLVDRDLRQTEHLYLESWEPWR